MGLVAKFTIATIFPSMTFKPIFCPNSILEHQPSEDLAFQSFPRFPNCGWNDGGGKVLKLRIVRRRRGVGAMSN
jgi:hypothetical protein